jgi:hypothetical protein
MQLPAKSYFCTNYKPGYRYPTFGRVEESPDSEEQCTGEEPGPGKTGTDSATENNCLTSVR